MPSVLIEVRKEYSQAQDVALMEVVHSALREISKDSWGFVAGRQCAAGFDELKKIIPEICSYVHW